MKDFVFLEIPLWLHFDFQFDECWYLKSINWTWYLIWQYIDLSYLVYGKDVLCNGTYVNLLETHSNLTKSVC